MTHALSYSVAYVVPMSLLSGLIWGGWFAVATPIVLFVVTPLVDELIPRSTDNASSEEEKTRLGTALYDWVVRLWLPVQVSLMIWTLMEALSGTRPIWEIMGLVLSAGLVGGAGINVAHELMHRKNKFDKALAELLTGSVTYTHFCVEHVYGHHKKVATKNDPATSRFGESLYQFLPRTLLGSLVSFWEIETNLVARKKGQLAWYKDRRVRYALEQGVVYGAVAIAFGVIGMAVWFAMGFIAACMLEVVNYLEHYGLERTEKRAGQFERVQPHHSWSSAHRLTGLLLFGLPRHADHHYLASRPYSILRHYDDCPQLPAGYATMFLLALCPPLWFRVMNPRVMRIRDGRDVATFGTEPAPSRA